jgi:class 3 adenylate cyclase/tetratricopeptide (TPR) repeat protein
LQVCPNCGEENPDKFRLCGYCGTKLAATVLQEVRKTVTIVFSDLKGSTTLGETLDTETLREVLNTYFREMQAILERHGGRVEKFIGDAIMAVFGLPRLHEDDALRAVRAAHEMQTRLRALNEELHRRWGVRLENRTGVNTGEVVAGDVTTGQRLVTGDAVNTAARLEQAAPTMEILVGEPTYRLVRAAVEVEPVEPLELKGKAEPVPAYRLIGVTGGEGFTRRLDAPMVGRQDEMAALTKTFERAVDTRTCQLVTILAQAGSGKSRLTEEFIRRVRTDAAVLKGRCLPYGEGITFWPLSEAVRQAAEISEEDPPKLAMEKLTSMLPADDTDVAERLSAMMDLVSTTFAMEETFWAARRFFEILSARRPLAVIFDDIHWAQPTLLDLIESLADNAEGPLVIVCPARPELLEERPNWGEGAPNGTRISLSPLSETESELIVQNLLGHAGLPAEATSKIIAAAEGNPLFVEQMLSMLIDEGLIQPEDGRWVLRDPSASFSVPPNIFGLLAARLDRLVAEERSVVERGSVIGHVFYKGAVQELSPEELKEQVGASLASLSLKQLIRPHEATFGDEEAFRFQHILIRDVAYQGLLKRARADMHESFAAWLEGIAGPRVTEYEELLGYHLEQAYRYRSELAPADEQGREVASLAARWLGSAGRRAFARGDMPAAANLLDRAASLLPTEESWRLDLLDDLSEALVDVGEVSKAVVLIEEGVQAAASSPDRRLRADLDLARLWVRVWTDPEVRSEEVLPEVEQTIAVFEEVGDQLGLANAWRLLGHLHGVACQFGGAEEATRRALNHAKLAGDRRQEIRNLSLFAQAATYGPEGVDEAIGRSEQALAEAAGHRKAEGVILGVLAQLEAMRGNFERARELYRKERATFEALGAKLDAASTSIDSGRVEMMAEEYEAAEAELRQDYQQLSAMGEKYFLPIVAGLLSHVLYLQERLDEADEFTHSAEEASAEDDVESQAIWRRGRAKVFAKRGRFEEAETLAREAHQLMSPTDAPIWKGNTLLDLAEVLELAGKRDEAVLLIDEAILLYEGKGDVVSAARARRRKQGLLTGNPEEVTPVSG